MLEEPLGVAVVGAGHWGANLIRNFVHAEGWDLRWVCDLDLDRARRALGRQTTIGVTDAIEKIVGDPAVAAVAIATPADSHALLASSVLRAGKHVVVEKPLAPSLEEAEVVVGLAREQGLVLMCDHTYCYTPAARHIRSLLRGRAIGQVQYVDSVRINLGIVQPDVDVFWDLAPHDLSILDFILPDETVPTAVAAHGSDPIGAGKACVGYVTLPLTGGGIAHAHVNWLSPTKIRRTIIGGSDGMIVWDDLHPSERVCIYDKSIAFTRDIRQEARISYRLGDMVAPALEEREPLQSVVEEFRCAIVEGRPPLTDGDAGIRILRVLDAIDSSLRHDGRLVSLGAYR